MSAAAPILRTVAWSPDARLPSLIEACQPVQLRQPHPAEPVGELTDEGREHAIQAAGWQVQAWMAQYEQTSCLLDVATAHAWRGRMENLIRGRSRDYVRRMEIRRGLI